MDKKWFLYLTLILVYCAGCSSTYQNTADVITSTPTTAITLGPLVAQWELASLPTLATDHTSLVIYAIRITSQDTIILVAISSSGTDKLASLSAGMQLQDESGSVSPVISSGILATLDTLELGYVRFAPRPFGASALALQISQNTGDPLELPIARFSDPPEDPSIYTVRTYLLGADQAFEQNGFRLSFTGWVAPTFDDVTIPASEQPGSPTGDAGTLATPTPYLPQPINPVEGITVTNEATLQIEAGSGESAILYVQFLSDGEVVGVLLR